MLLLYDLLCFSFVVLSVAEREKEDNNNNNKKTPESASGVCRVWECCGFCGRANDGTFPFSGMDDRSINMASV